MPNKSVWPSTLYPQKKTKQEKKEGRVHERYVWDRIVIDAEEIDECACYMSEFEANVDLCKVTSAFMFCDVQQTNF